MKYIIIFLIIALLPFNIPSFPSSTLFNTINPIHANAQSPSINIYLQCQINSQGNNYNYWTICGGFGHPYDKETGFNTGSCGDGLRGCASAPYMIQRGTWIMWQGTGCTTNTNPTNGGLFVPYNITNIVNTGITCIGQLDPTSSPVYQNLTFAIQGAYPNGVFIWIFILNGITRTTPYVLLTNQTTISNTNTYYQNMFSGHYIKGSVYYNVESYPASTFPSSKALNTYSSFVNQSAVTGNGGFQGFISYNAISSQENPSETVAGTGTPFFINGYLLIFNPVGIPCQLPYNGGFPYGTVENTAVNYTSGTNINSIEVTINNNFYCAGDTIIVGSESNSNNNNPTMSDNLGDTYTKQIQVSETAQSYFAVIFTGSIKTTCNYNCNTIHITLSMTFTNPAIQVIMIHGLNSSSFASSSMASDSVLPCQVNPPLSNQWFMWASCITNNGGSSSWTTTHTGYKVLNVGNPASLASEYITNNPYTGSTNMNFSYGTAIANWAEVAIGASLLPTPIPPPNPISCNQSSVIILGLAIGLAIILFILLLWQKAKYQGLTKDTIMWVVYFVLIIIILLLIGSIAITTSSQICSSS